MIAPDVEIADIEPRHWLGWFNLLVPESARVDPRWALILLDDGQPLTIMLDGVGSAARTTSTDEASFRGTSPAALKQLAAELDVDAVVAVERQRLPEIQAEIDRSLTLTADYVDQCMVILRILKTYSGRGLWSEPALLDLLPNVSFDALQRTFDLLIPDNTSMVAYLFSGPEIRGVASNAATPSIVASVIAVKRRGSIQRVATHLGVADAIAEGHLAGDWRKRYKRLLSAVTADYAPPSVAVFLERDTFYRIATGPTDQFAREMTARNVIIDPAPAWLLGLLGGATMAAFATRGAKALARVLPRSARKMASGFASTANAVMRDTGAHPFALLGFDPIALWHRLRHFYGQKTG